MIEEEKILPKDWKIIKLSAAGKIISGGTPSTTTPEYWNGNINWVSPADLTGYKKIKISKGAKSITELGLQKSSARLMPKGSVLFSSRAPIGYVAIAGEELATNQGFKNIIPNENFLSEFLYYFLKASKQKAENAASGTTFKEISLSKFSELEIPLPPKPTQQAIVSKIEELFSELDRGIEKFKTAQQRLKTYRQAVLKWAFEGKLTSKKGEWKNVRLGDIANAIDPQPSHRTPPVVTNGVPFVSIKDFDSEEDKIDFTHARKVSKDVLKEHVERYKLEIGDFVIGKIGTIGKPVRIVLPQDYCLSANIVLIQPRKVSATYLYYFFQSTFIEKAFTVGMKATTQAAFGIQKVRELRIELPHEEEQNKIVQEIESRLSVADKMEESISQNLQQAEALRQSILKKAFEGRLLPAETQAVEVKKAKIIPIERKILAAKLIYLQHEKRHFGLTNFQKLLYLVENFAEVEYETNFLQETAGPYDRFFTQAFRKEMKENKWFSEEQKGIITKFVPEENVGSIISKYAQYFRNKSQKIVFAIQQLQGKSTHDAELIATLYAVWNNRLIKKKPIKIGLLIEDFYNWSPKKKEQFQKEEIENTYKWLRMIKLVPSGFGPAI